MDDCRENTIKNSPEYRSFLSSVPKKKYIVDPDGQREWTVFDAGPKTVRSPLVFLPPVSGSADVFFRQILALSSLGYRIIAIDSPACWSVREWCLSFRRLLDHLRLDLVHLFGSSLGGFLAQKFAEMTHRSPRVKSLVLCNTFNDTTVFGFTSTANTFWMMPSVVLKKMVISGFEKKEVDVEIADAIDFMVEKLDGLSQEILASRLTLNCLNNYVEPQRIHNQNVPVTIIDVFDEAALSNAVSNEMYKCYPDARLAHLKSGGNFPFLSRSAEVNIHIRIHLQEFVNTRYAPFLPSSPAHVTLDTFPTTTYPEGTSREQMNLLVSPGTCSFIRGAQSSDVPEKNLDELDLMMKEINESSEAKEDDNDSMIVSHDIVPTENKTRNNAHQGNLGDPDLVLSEHDGNSAENLVEGQIQTYIDETPRIPIF